MMFMSGTSSLNSPIVVMRIAIIPAVSESRIASTVSTITATYYNTKICFLKLLLSTFVFNNYCVTYTHFDIIGELDNYGRLIKT